jgi:SAM-dependent methyltransferase
MGIEIVECPVERMPFPDGAFDAVVLSHVLEHCSNVGLALLEVRRVVGDGGWVLVVVPPSHDFVCAGHVSMGWNVGQLIYVLLVNGFDVVSGRFIEHGYNVAGFVRKAWHPLPPLRNDRGDIHILRHHFPLAIRPRGGFSDGFHGKLRAVNWPDASPLLRASAPRLGLRTLAERLGRWLPDPWRTRVGLKLKSLGSVLELVTANPRELG